MVVPWRRAIAEMEDIRSRSRTRNAELRVCVNVTLYVLRVRFHLLYYTILFITGCLTDRVPLAWHVIAIY